MGEKRGEMPGTGGCLLERWGLWNLNPLLFALTDSQKHDERLDPSTQMIITEAPAGQWQKQDLTPLDQSAYGKIGFVIHPFI